VINTTITYKYIMRRKLLVKTNYSQGRSIHEMNDKM